MIICTECEASNNFSHDKKEEIVDGVLEFECDYCSSHRFFLECDECGYRGRGNCKCEREYYE